jgi:hypothetical protein
MLMFIGGIVATIAVSSCVMAFLIWRAPVIDEPQTSAKKRTQLSRDPKRRHVAA